MTNKRIELLKTFLEKDAADSFSRYAMALEYLNGGDISTAITEFETLKSHDANYTATYYHLGKAYEKAGNPDLAKAVYQTGILLTAEKGEAHANKELREALFMLTGGDDDDD
jgi:Tfp pilus assembly protein PilF